MASAASRSVQLILLISTTCFLGPLSLHAQEANSVASPPPQTTFSFNFSNTSSYNLTRDMRLEGYASQNGNLVDLNIDHNFGSTTGRMSYNYPVRFYDNTTLASFSTHFTFEIVPVPNPRDGMVFFLSSYPSRISAGGGYLGLYNDASAQFIGVEFDTYKNEWDPDGKHIGININSFTSSNTTSLPDNLNLSGTMTATITFDSITGMLVASLLLHDQPSTEPVVVSVELDHPKSLLPWDVAVGFAGSSAGPEGHYIHTWSFNSTFSPTTTPPETTFSFNFSNTSSYNLKRDFRLEGDASQNGSLIDLNIDHKLGSSTGRMSYNYPVRFYDGTTLASFSTRFTFEIVLVPYPRDGMVFFLSSYPSRISAGGGYLGLYNDVNAQFIGVEFDTFQNEWDPDDKHIGININSFTSSNTTSLTNNLKLSGTMTATITFDSITGMLVASLLLHDHPSTEPVVVSVELDHPKSLLPWDVAVGFAGSSAGPEGHHIHTWSFNSTFAPPTPPKGRKSIVLVIAVVAPILALFICGIVSFKFIRRHTKGKMNVKEQDEALVWVVGRSSEFIVYDFLQVLEATNNFSEENKLGQGGFGPVYKGQFHDGLEIAVKRLASHSGQGFREFNNEIELIAKLQHTNLVRLLGCSSQGDERLLIYEYMPNKSLDFYIFDEIQRALLDWNKRLAIIEGISQGILYLHKHSRLRVIHRDLKAGNILLDREMNPKISDFGLAKIFSLTDTEGNTKRIVGTYGYMAPEYASEGLFSIKSDVFSFGVLILEIISGKRTSSLHQYGDFINLLGHARQLWKDGLWLQLVDTSVGEECHVLQIGRCINIALLCVQENAVDRPNMSQVVSMLTSDSMALPEPKHPAYFHVRVGAVETSDVVEPSSNANVTISSVHGR
ncbi:unnamed protein product [Urochloa humidicola]